jgi:hypothetical protein
MTSAGAEAKMKEGVHAVDIALRLYDDCASIKESFRRKRWNGATAATVFVLSPGPFSAARQLRFPIPF